MKLIPRLTVLLIVLVSVQFIVGDTVRSLTPKGIELPDTPLSAMPHQFGDWVCDGFDDEEIETEDKAGATVSLSRIYRSVDHRAAITAYVGIWTDYSLYLPHPPWDCYKASGHTIVDKTELKLKHANGAPFKTMLMTVKEEDQSAYILFWYRAGADSAMGGTQLKPVHREHRGKGKWPPLVKVMLEIRGHDEESARMLLADLGQKMLNWTSRSLVD